MRAYLRSLLGRVAGGSNGTYDREETVIDHFQYLLLMAGCLLITLPLEFALRARVYRRWRVLLAAVVPVIIIFSIWDIVAIHRGHWTYDPRFVTGIRLVGGLPLEEIVFFFVVPVCGLLSYEAVGTVITMRKQRRSMQRG
jgi:lycopene cyclase domain-containing protein